MIFIIRHGQTRMNKAMALQGRSDQPLNENGIMQAEEAGARLAACNIHFTNVFTSPLQRAVQTAQLIVPNVTPHVEERLIEMDYGPYEGCDLKNPPPELLSFFNDFVNQPAPEGMEPLGDVVTRTGAFIEELKDLKGNILVSTHAIAMKGILEYLTPESGGSYWSKYIGNCAIYVTDCKDGRFSVPKEWEPLMRE